jgi:hypothetical protein
MEGVLTWLKMLKDLITSLISVYRSFAD